MRQNIVCDSACEDTKYSFGIKEEPLDASSVTDIDIKHDSSCAFIKDEIDIKEEPLVGSDDSDLNSEMRRSDLVNQSSSNSRVSSLRYSFYFVLF